MKRAAAISLAFTILLWVFVPAIAEDSQTIDLSNYNFQQLISLRQQIDGQLTWIATNEDHSDYSLDGLVYVSNGSEICINLYEGTNPLVIIPSEIEGLPVTKVHQNTFKSNKTITAVILPDGMTEIPERFFSGCTNLESVIMPSSITKIGSYSFEQLFGIKSLVLHEGITHISINAFYRCLHIEGVLILPSTLQTLDAKAFEGCDDLSGVIIQGDTSVWPSAFLCKNLKFVYVKNGCMPSFKANSFGAGLEVAILPDSVISIDEEAFSECNRLTIVCPAGSYAESYAKSHFIMCDTEHYNQYVQEYDAQYIQNN